MMKKVMLILSCLFLSVGLIYSQTIAVNGTVVDDAGVEVVGASVVVKGTTTGVATNIDGQFSLNVPSNSTLEFSLIGMKKTEMKATSNMRVVMENDEAMLDEVLVVAYGTAKKSQFTGSAAMLGADKLSQRSVSDVTNALSGQLAGVQVSNIGGGQPGTEATIRIRGIGSMSSSNKPLYVIDGVPFDGSLSSINSHDIESLTVLKDAAANAIYGARGANGVVMITTKRGTSENARVSIDMKWGSNSRAIPKYDVMDSPAAYYETFYKAFYNSQFYNGKSVADSHAYANQYLLDSKDGLGYNVYTLPQGQTLIGQDFRLNPNAKLGYSDGQYYYTPDDWYDETFGKGNLRQEYNVSIAGKSNATNYYVSLGYLDDKGIIPNSGFSRFSGRANVESQAKSWLKVGGNIGYSYTDLKEPDEQTKWGSTGNVFAITDNIAPIYPMYVRKASGEIWIDERNNPRYDYGGSTNFKRPYSTPANPVGSLALDKYNNESDLVNAKTFATITIIEGLQLTANLGANIRNSRGRTLQNPFYGAGAGSAGSVSMDQLRDFSINQQYLGTYAFNLNNKHNIDVLAGFESYNLKKQMMEMSNTKLYNPNVGEIGNTIGASPSIDSGTNKYTTEGVLSRVQYNYMNKYFLSASYRRDGSSRFHKDNRWGNFGSGGGAWLISQEDFMKTSWIDMLKFKISYGVQGNDNLLMPPDGTGIEVGSYYPYTDQYEIMESEGAWSVVPTYKGNKDITWETSYSFNTGFEFELFKRRLNGSFDYFRRTTDDLLYYQPKEPSQGYAQRPMNIGEIVNQGVEIDLTGVVFTNRNIDISVFANATHVSNEITKLHPNTEVTGGIRGGNYIYRVGGSLYNTYMRQYAGVDTETGRALYYVDPDNGDWSTTDNYNAARQADQGNTLPKVYGGFGVMANAYGFDFSIQFAYQLGGRLYDGTYESLMHTGDDKGNNWHKDIQNAWTPENKNTNTPRLNTADTSNQKQSSRFLMTSNYLSLNSLVLGYTVPKKHLNMLKIESLRFYMTGDNLALISKRKGFDPRTSIGLGSSTTSGSFKYSSLRNISGGVSVTF